MNAEKEITPVIPKQSISGHRKIIRCIHSTGVIKNKSCQSSAFYATLDSLERCINMYALGSPVDTGRRATAHSKKCKIALISCVVRPSWGYFKNSCGYVKTEWREYPTCIEILSRSEPDCNLLLLYCGLKYTRVQQTHSMVEW